MDTSKVSNNNTCPNSQAIPDERFNFVHIFFHTTELNTIES